MPFHLMRSRPAIVLTLVATAALPARADRRDLYVAASLGPAFTSLRDSQAGGASAAVPGYGGSIAAWYGLTDTLHLGVAARLAGASSASFSGVTAQQRDGSTAKGTLYEDLSALGLGALARYRFDTGRRWAPWAELELGLSVNRYANQLLVTDAGVGSPVADTSKAGVSARAAFGIEYRFGERWLLGVGIAAQGSAGGLRPWQFDLPVTVAWIL